MSYRQKRSRMSVLKKGHLLYEKDLTFRYIKTQKDNPTLLSFIVSSKVAKKAVDRNKLKRKGREFIKKNKLKNGYNGVFFFKKTSLVLSNKELEEEIKKILKKTNII